MKLFKNYVSKKKLREENIRLNALLNQPARINIVERNVLPYKTKVILENNMPVDYAKKIVCERIACLLYENNMVEYDVEDNDYLGKMLIGTVYIGVRK